VNGRSWSTEVHVAPDPRLALVQNVQIPAVVRRVQAREDEEKQLKFALKIRDDISRVSRVVNRIRSIKKQLDSRHELLKDHHNAAPLVLRGKDLSAKLDALEGQLHNSKAEVAYDILAQRGGAKLYSKLIALLDWAIDSDSVPTQGMREVYAECSKELQQHE